MKKIILVLFLLSATHLLKAQDIQDDAEIVDIYDWYPRQMGVKIGVNSTTLNSSKNQMVGVTAESYSKFGYTANLSYWIPITPLFRPRIELSYDVLKSDVDFTKLSNNGSFYSFAGETQFSQGSLVILPEIVFGKNIQFSIFVGFQFSALISAYEKGTAINSDSAATIVSTIYIDQKNNTIGEDVDTGLLTGFGARYRLSKKIYLNAETRFRFGTSMVYGIYKPYYWGISGGIIYQL